MKSLNDLIIERHTLEKKLHNAATVEEKEKIFQELDDLQTTINTWGTQSDAVYRII